MQVKFCGAAKIVTGSCYLVESMSQKFLIDCGMFQGQDVEELNREEFLFEPSQIDFLLLTHAHLDHSGLIPKLVAEGFDGKIFCTLPTAQIIEYSLLDSAKVQENELKYKNIPPLYTHNDAVRSLQLVNPIPFNQKQHIGDTSFTFRNSSHILGAASIEIECDNKTVCFSGDLGRQQPTIINGFSNTFENPDYIIMECLYGYKNHEPLQESLDHLSNIVNKTIERNGNVIIPVFAIHRSQEILHYLHLLKLEGKIPKDVQIFFDSPLGEKVLNVYTHSFEHLNDSFKKITDPYGLANGTTFIRTTRESIKLKKQSGSIILAGGGMLEGGRVLNHLAAFSADPRSSLVIVGFQAEGTLGRTLLSHPSEIEMNRRKFHINFNIEEIYGFSAHADKSDLKGWLGRFDKGKLKKIFLTHSSEEQANLFKDQYGDIQFEIPNLGSSYSLD